MKLMLRRFAHLRTLICGMALLTSACLDPAREAESPSSGTSAAEDSAADDGGIVAAPFVATGPRDFMHTSTELMKELKIGWNLGNALDAPENETAWGNPTITPELLKAVAAKGFRVVRIPVTWSKHTGPGPDFRIEQSWLERVREVVGYAHAAGLYAIINVHHDGADGFTEVEWLTLNDSAGKTTEKNNRIVKERFVKVWEQIAASFADFGEELLFESMNEIHDGYGPANPKHMEFINELNQTFVRLVRASGGNNVERHLVVPGYNTNIEHTLTGFKAPDDSTKDRLILSVHFYDPYLFALQAKVHTWGANSPGRDDWGQEDHVTSQFDKLKTAYVDRGLPVLIGEYGATHQAGYEDYRRYYMEYVTWAAVKRGLVPVYWDNGGQKSGGENFGLFDRRSGRVLHPALLEAMMRATQESATVDEIAPPRPQP